MTEEKPKDIINCKKYGQVSIIDNCPYCGIGTFVKRKLKCENYDNPLPASNENSNA